MQWWKVMLIALFVVIDFIDILLTIGILVHIWAEHIE